MSLLFENTELQSDRTTLSIGVNMGNMTFWGKWGKYDF